MLIKHYLQAWRGYRIWKRIDRQLQSPLYLLMPKETDEYNYYALLYLEEYMKRKGLQEAVALTCDEEAIAALQAFVPNGKAKGVRLSGKEAARLIKYYALYEFTSRLVIVSLSEPYDTHGENLLGVHGVGKEDLVCFDIYKFGEKPQIASVNYEGEDQRVIAFLNRASAQNKTKTRTGRPEK